MTRLLPIDQNTDLVSLNVIVGGKALPGRVHIRTVEIQRSVGRIPFARLMLEDGDPGAADFAVSADAFFAAGATVAIEAGYHGATSPVFQGVVVRQRIGIRDCKSWLEVDCRDAAFRMTLTRRIRRFEDKTDSAAIDEILSDYDLTGAVASTDVTHPQLVQYQATDWDFVMARLDANGQLLAVEDGTLRSFVPALQSQATAEVVYGTNLIEFDAEFDARSQPGAVTAFAWDPASQALVSVEAADPSWTPPGNQDAAAMTTASGRTSDAIWHGGALASDALQAWADGRLLRDRIAATRGRARCQGFATLKLGDTLAVSGVGARFEGGVLVSGLRHVFEGNTWTLDVEFGVDPAFHAERFDIRAPAASALAAQVEGLAMGVVTKIHDDPLGEGRVRVRLTLADGDTEGVWARLATLDAGGGRGTCFRPEPDDEVVVGFFHADPAHPVILGALHSSARAAPEEPSKENHQKGYTSREGLKLVFDDDAEAVIIETPGGNSLTLSDGDKGIVLADQNGNTISMTKDGITFDSAKALTLTAAGDLKGSGVNLEFSASASLKAEGSASAAVTSSGMLEVSGSVVMIN
jgi:Rhs element Vgr protein